MSEIVGLFSNPECDVTGLFSRATYAHLARLFELWIRDISSNFCLF
jgi:hypothetical protein